MRADLAAGASLSEVTSRLSARLGVNVPVVPASDDPIRTRVRIADGSWLSFQDYFVVRGHRDTVTEEKSASEYRADMLEYEAAKLEGRDCPEPTTYHVYEIFRTRVARLVHFEDGVVASWEEPDEMWLDEWHRR